MYVVMTSGMVERMYFGWIESTFSRKQTSLMFELLVVNCRSHISWKIVNGIPGYRDVFGVSNTGIKIPITPSSSGL